MSQIKGLDLKPLSNLIVDRNVYILDASATFNKPEFDEYKLDLPALIIITTVFLREIDNLKNKNQQNRDNYNILTSKLRKLNEKSKLSDGINLTKNKWIYFFPCDLIELPDYIPWLDNSYNDKHLINFALFLKKRYKHPNIYLTSADNLIRIIANEKDIKHKYIEHKRARTSRKPIKFEQNNDKQTIDLHNQK